MSLVKAIDGLLAFVKHKDDDHAGIAAADYDRFCELDQQVNRLAMRAGLDAQLPNINKLARLLDAPSKDFVQRHGHKPVGFIGSTNLPGDWDEGIFLLAGVFLWREAMLILRSRAERPRKRRRQSESKIVPLTPKQTEAMQLVGEHKGNIAAAARAAGKSRPAMEKLYNKALKKLGKRSVEKTGTQALPTDARGQPNVVDPKSKKHFLKD